MPQIVAPPKNEVIEKRPIITTCPHCQYTISYTKDEVERVDNDGLGIMCPNCDEPIVLEHIEPFTFPDTFYHFGTSEGAVCLSDDMVFGFKLEDEDAIYVAKSYWQDSVFK